MNDTKPTKIDTRIVALFLRADLIFHYLIKSRSYERYTSSTRQFFSLTAPDSND